MLVKEVTTRTAEGCRITSRAVPADSERLYGPSCMEQIEFPPPRALGSSGRVAGMTDVLERLLPHLERGVLLWVAPEGVFMKRQCQGRVYWNGPLAPHRDWPNKLEREKTYKLLDTQQFLQRKCPPAVLGARGLLDPAPGDPSPLGNGVSSCPGTAAAGCGAAGTSCPLTEQVSCRAAGVPEPRAAHATVPDPPVLRGGVPHQHRAPLPETHHGPREYAPGLALAVAPSWEPVGGHTDPCPFSVGSMPPQVEPVFARELFHHAQRMGPMLLHDSPQPCPPGSSSHIIRVLKQLCQP